MSKRMMALRLGFACAALSNFYPAMKKHGLVKAFRETAQEVLDALKPL